MSVQTSSPFAMLANSIAPQKAANIVDIDEVKLKVLNVATLYTNTHDAVGRIKYIHILIE